MSAAAARIGPNAIIQTAAALRARCGDAAAARIVRAATGRTLDGMPGGMVDEAEVNRLMREVHRVLREEDAGAVLAEAGERTAAYLLAHRIPRAVQRLLRLLPAPLALRVLLAAILRHRWTFAGSAEVRVRRVGGTLHLELHGCPLCRGRRSAHPACGFYAGTMQALVARLVSPRARVREVACEAAGDPNCSFALGV